MVHSFLIIGQSNMAGRGFKEEVPSLFQPRMKTLINGRWQEAFFPLNRDRAFSGICLAESFADAYLKDHEGVDIGLIPCADGGTRIDMWEKGSLLYDNALNCARLAMRTSVLVGVLWHQGESDCRDELIEGYEKKLSKLIDHLREDLGQPDIPFIVGGLGSFLDNAIQTNPAFVYCKNHPIITEKIRGVAAEKENVGYASAEGLTSNPDFLHFNAKSLRELGLRYYAEFKKYEKEITAASEGEEIIRTDLEKL